MSRADGGRAHIYSGGRARPHHAVPPSTDKDPSTGPLPTPGGGRRPSPPPESSVIQAQSATEVTWEGTIESP